MELWLQAQASDTALLQSIQTTSEAYPVSYSISTVDFFTVVKCPGFQADHWPQLVLRWRMNDTVIALSVIYAPMVCTGTTLPVSLHTN